MKICVYAICKNESKFIDRWFNSIKNADYICVLDTGSTDNTYEKLLELKSKFPEKVFINQKEIKPWRFDAARNESMKLIPADTSVCISTDLDDVFKPNWKEVILDDIQKGYNKIIGGYQYYDGDTPTIYTKLDRVSLYGEAHWEEAIHERLICENPREIHDDRFIVEHRQDLTKDRREFYFETAKAAVDENDSHSLLCFGYECYNSEKYEESISCFSKLFDISPKNSEYLTRKWIKLVADIYAFLNNKEAQITWLKRALEVNNQSSPFEDYNLYNGIIETELKKLTWKVCAYTICKNEIKNVENWIKPLATADYICVLDTGSTDGTYEKFLDLQKQYKNLYVEQKIYKKFWYDTAKNDALALVRKVVNLDDTNILINLDLDEYATDDIASALKTEWVPGCVAADILCRTSEIDGMYLTRCHLLTEDLHWKYKIHEEISCFGSPNRFTLQTCSYGHYPDKTHDHNYYKVLQEAHEIDPTCLHYLIYLIWAGSEVHDTSNVPKYCLEIFTQILENTEDDHYHDWQYYIYACIIYLSMAEASINLINKWLDVLNGQEVDYRSYYIFKAQLYEKLGNNKEVCNNLIKASLLQQTNSWLERDFDTSDNFIFSKLMLVYYYNIKDYEKAYLWAEKAVINNSSDLNKSNLEFCKKALEESLNGK